MLIDYYESRVYKYGTLRGKYSAIIATVDCARRRTHDLKVIHLIDKMQLFSNQRTNFLPTWLIRDTRCLERTSLKFVVALLANVSSMSNMNFPRRWHRWKRRFFIAMSRYRRKTETCDLVWSYRSTVSAHAREHGPVADRVHSPLPKSPSMRWRMRSLGPQVILRELVW